jgi:hypothetical protein
MEGATARVAATEVWVQAGGNIALDRDSLWMIHLYHAYDAFSRDATKQLELALSRVARDIT